MAILGFDLAPLKDGVQAAFAALRQAGQDGPPPDQQQPGLNTGLIQAAQAPPGLNTGLIGYGTQQGAGDPWATLGQVAGQQFGLNTGLLGYGTAQVGTDFSGPFALRDSIVAQNAQRVGKGVQEKGAPNATAGGTYTGPATSDDNKTLTAQQVDDWIAKTRPNSPLVGKGEYILRVANEYGISAPLLLGIFLKESELGTTAGANKNIAGLTDPATDGGLGGVRTFQGSGTWEDAIGKAAANLASPLYKGKSLQEQVGTWYVGPQAWAQQGAGATDQAGNGTVQDYVNMVAQVYQGLGVPLNATQAGMPTANTSVGRSGAPVTPVSAHGYATPVVGYTGSIDLHHGEDSGAADIMAPGGTPIAAMRGGRVVDAGWNSLGGWTVTIQGDDGLTYYYAHMQQQPGVQAGESVRAGTLIGAVGDTGNAQGTGTHLHLGIGYGIASGAGAHGGAGENFNAVDLLRQVYGGY